ncbi:pentapeptide repeat-containing protein [Tabrizicola sp.]|uniref:pentapeptide repeat-containing protein n=1 Tax=Tabrizicola sp. TaxID=2005166 RepID=UPI0035B18E45
MTVPESQPEPAKGGSRLRGKIVPGGMGLLFFGFGLSAGILGAYTATGFLEDSAGLILSVFLSALLVVLILGILIFALRKTILSRLFGHAEVALEQIADPLARIADRAIDRDPGGATTAARDLVAMVLARYAWITTRRWIIASLTALIAAMAALAGTALLFKQNQLIATQTDLLREQNTRIQEQTQLIQTDVQLAEAARNAALAVEITDIAAELGKVVDRVHGKDLSNPFNVLDPATDIDRSLFLRIVSISRALMPYRFLDTGLHEEDATDGLRQALQRRRGDLGDGYPKLEAYFGWADRPEGTWLVDRPASPERGQLLRVMVSSGLRNLELFTFAGLTLDHAMLKATDLSLITAQQARLSYADFSGSYLVECDFGSAILENARFRRAHISRSRFAALTADQVLPPLPPQAGLATTRLSGADFSRATIQASDFSGAALTAASFDGALLDGVTFANADLSAATFVGTVILDADFTGVSLKRTDFDGAVVFGADFLIQLAAEAAPETFRPELFRLDPLDPADLSAIMVVQDAFTPEDLATRTKGAAPFRITRIAEFGP